MSTLALDTLDALASLLPERTSVAEILNDRRRRELLLVVGRIHSPATVERQADSLAPGQRPNRA